MYQYNHQDRTNLAMRRKVYQRQHQRFIEGKISDSLFRPIRLQHGLYIQRHGPMLRIAIPYGLLSSNQLRTLADVTRQFDRGYCHFTTRQNVQLNWVKLQDISEILEALAKADLHSIQTSGNCIRNITSDPFAGVAEDEIIDPRPYCELIRQWSLGHPEFAYLPRKFKIAVTGAKEDRAIIQAHDIGLRLRLNADNKKGFQVIVGGGLGRTPVIGTVLTDFVPQHEILDYLTAILRVYNQYGRRDNKYKARIKILVKSIGLAKFKQQVDEAWISERKVSTPLNEEALAGFARHFLKPAYEIFDQEICDRNLTIRFSQNDAFKRWVERNTQAHKINGYRSVTLSLKGANNAPGDATYEQLEQIAAMADEYAFGVVRTTHEQNLILAHVPVRDLYDLWRDLCRLDLATPNIGTITDMICCPGLDYCSLANTPSIPLAGEIQRLFDDQDYLYDIGNITLNISGCMNACAHHHLANIGILGVLKRDEPYFQVSMGGQKGNHSEIGKILGPSFSAAEMPGVVESIIQTYLSHRIEREDFIDTFRRIGIKVFKEVVYGNAH